MGTDKLPPDEFTILTKPNLIIPPEYNLRPPAEGEIRPDPQQPNRQLQSILFGQNKTDEFSTSEINLMQGLRTGAYALRCQYYNFSTGDYDESTYSAAKSWSKLAHLGSQDGLTPGQQSLAKRPTRIVSAILDDESYYSGQDAAANDLAFKDRTPETLPQAISSE